MCCFATDYYDELHEINVVRGSSMSSNYEKCVNNILKNQFMQNSV